MDSLIIFTDNTKRDFVITASGLMMIALASATKPILGGMASAVMIIGIMLISSSVLLMASQIKHIYDTNPNFLTDYNYDPYRKNIYVGIGLCSILTLLIIYSLYTLFT